MATTGLPPPPINDNPGSFTWLEWYRQLRNYISTSGSVPWYVINFADSNLTDIQTRDHNTLTALQGGRPDEYYHLTAAQAASIGAGYHNDLLGLQGGNSAQRFHLTEAERDWTTAATNGVVTVEGSSGGTGILDMIPDPTTPGSDVFEISSDDGINIKAPYVVIDTTNPLLTMPGPVISSNIVVAGIDTLGRALLGYGAPIKPNYSIQTSNSVVVPIKVAGAVPPTAWVDLGLTLNITQDILAGEGTATFEMILVNPTTHNGIVEFGLRVNGVDTARNIIQQIPSNFRSTVALSVPLLNGYSSGDELKLIARVTENNNNAFSLSMNTGTSTAIFRISTGGTGGSGFISGQIGTFAFGSIPQGWLVCNGSAVSRTTYGSLFTAIGTTWGAGDGSTTFNLPNSEPYTQNLYKTGSGGVGTPTTLICIKI